MSDYCLAWKWHRKGRCQCKWSTAAEMNREGTFPKSSLTLAGNFELRLVCSDTCVLTVTKMQQYILNTAQLSPHLAGAEQFPPRGRQTFTSECTTLGWTLHWTPRIQRTALFITANTQTKINRYFQPMPQQQQRTSWFWAPWKANWRRVAAQ